ncbi:lysylphosphatidylglycerol synthase transmembrane domain-containing protein [Pseudomonas citrulli]|uniref:Lysylphosphatidylglycerol synthase transmembrane domain-containing protein n=1 Tax=Pseudomonas citrulli TaxID=3064347 RepID=A0ABT9C5X5_9PSED|nr:lysylphosphatidylglycerol synthase transmembrane domain-containing protein [Pseudomonas sp. K18]MDO7899574.1 lysylphosphatidylglycerol synthase transmembrane domain-containing protein [Pseudomonas sp. K18]
MNQALLLSGWRYRLLIGSVVCSTLAYLGASLWSGWSAVGDAISRVGWFGVMQVVGLVLLGYGLRFLRWQVYLHALQHRLPWWPSLKMYLAGFALTTTPGKAGEALRGVLLKRWGVPYADSFAALFSERLSDLVAMVMLALIGLSGHREWLAPIVICLLVLIGSVVLMVHEPFVVAIAQRIDARQGWFFRVLRSAVDVLRQARRCHAPYRLLGASALGIAAWSLEALAFYWIVQVMGLDVALASAAFIYAVSMLAGAVSFMPGGLGSAEAVMVAFLVSSGAALGSAVAATVLLRLVTLWFAVGLGTVTLTSIRQREELNEH